MNDIYTSDRYVGSVGERVYHVLDLDSLREAPSMEDALAASYRTDQAAGPVQAATRCGYEEHNIDEYGQVFSGPVVVWPAGKFDQAVMLDLRGELVPEYWVDGPVVDYGGPWPLNEDKGEGIIEGDHE